MKRKLWSSFIAFLPVLIFISAQVSTAHAACVVSSDNSGMLTQTLYAGKTINAGNVSVQVDGDNLLVTYATVDGWEITSTHLWIGESLALMPQTKTGNPKIGNFPYKSGEIAPTTLYTFTIPLTTLNFVCPSDDKTYYIAAHADMRKPNGSGGYQTETGWATGNALNGGSWATYFTFTLTCNCGVDPEDPGETRCETAFAVADANRNFAYDKPPSYCFLTDLAGLGISDSFSRWGWTNGTLAPGSYTFELYAGAAKCSLTKGTKVGTVTVNYTGSSATVTYNLDAPYFLTETHVYAGNAPLPMNNGSYTVAPGQYPYIHGDLNATNSRPNSDSFNISGIGGSIYYIAHASVCGFPLQ